MKNKKISIIGVGCVGATIAYSVMLKNLADEIVLIDINKEQIESEILDIKHGFYSISGTKIYAGDYCDIKNSNLIIITAGRSRKPNETRLDMVLDNVAIIKNIAKNIETYYNDGIILVVSNPVDIITYQLAQALNLQTNKIIGTGCVLDTSRFIFKIADYLNCNIKDVDATIVGEHGDSQVALWSKVTVNKISINEYCKYNNINFNNDVRLLIEQKVTKMGAQIISGKGKTHYGIATSVCFLANAILNNIPIVASVSTCFNGELGLKNVSLSVPSILNSQGAKKEIIDNWSDLELNKFIESANNLQNIIKQI